MSIVLVWGFSEPRTAHLASSLILVTTNSRRCDQNGTLRGQPRGLTVYIIHYSDNITRGYVHIMFRNIVYWVNRDSLFSALERI